MLLITGVAAAGAMLKRTADASPVPDALVPANHTVVCPAAAGSGVPVIAPVAVTKDKPGGSVPLVTEKEAPVGLAVSVKPKTWPT